MLLPCAGAGKSVFQEGCEPEEYEEKTFFPPLRSPPLALFLSLCLVRFLSVVSRLLDCYERRARAQFPSFSLSLSLFAALAVGFPPLKRRKSTSGSAGTWRDVSMGER